MRLNATAWNYSVADDGRRLPRLTPLDLPPNRPRTDCGSPPFPPAKSSEFCARAWDADPALLALIRPAGLELPGLAVAGY